MTIEVRAVGFSLTAGLADHAERAFRRLEARFSQAVRAVHVHLSDINGPHKGNDKRCLVEVELPRSRRIVVEETDADMYAAIDSAADRAAQTVSREIGRCSRRSRLHRFHAYSEPDASGVNGRVS